MVELNLSISDDVSLPTTVISAKPFSLDDAEISAAWTCVPGGMSTQMTAVDLLIAVSSLAINR